VATAGAYWFLAVLVKWYFSSYQMWPAPLWLPAGVALFAAVAVGRWSWPGIFLSALLTDIISFNEPLAWAAGLAFAHTLAPVIAAEVLRSRIVRSEPFCRVTDVIYIGLAACPTGTIAATVCATAICAREYAPLQRPAK
jgi:integral membrane sensor domain MASE1